ncbi:MAG: aminopeptidase P N-terminal domain-containing protein [Flavobacteriales bacterium]|nr:aminopeptidase P N-terminal domain-containing protein [Flavobacteriales bacterium]
MIRIPIILTFLTAVSMQAQEIPVSVQFGEPDNGVYDEDLLPAEFHKDRRATLRARLPGGGVAVVFSNPVRNRSNDIDYEYHRTPIFLHGGHNEPNAMVFVFKEPRMINGVQASELLVVQPRDPTREVWNGLRTGKEGALTTLGFEAAMTGEEFLDWEADWSESDKIYVQATTENLTSNKHQKASLSELLDHFRTSTTKATQANAVDLQDWMAQLREVKQIEELAMMRKAIDITCLAQNELMTKLRPEMTEYQTEAIVEYVFKSNGAEDEGFPSIQGSGPHSCVLHYLTNRRTLGHNDLLVSDIGAEYHGYTADVTRTLPANGKFSPEQKIIYNLVYDAQEAGIAEVRKGNAFHAAHRAATAVIVKGLIANGLIPMKVRFGSTLCTERAIIWGWMFTMQALTVLWYRAM